MPLRKLLSVTLDNNSRMTAPSSLLSTWDICTVNDLGMAQKALNNFSYPVGLLLFTPDKAIDFEALEVMLDTHTETQWVGVFPADKVKQSAYRHLVVRHFFDFHTWPIDAYRLTHTLGHAYGYAELCCLPDKAPSEAPSMGLIGQGLALKNLRAQIIKVARSEAPVLVWGESGSGKELTAKAVHDHSPRASGPFVAVNCGAFPANLIQSELFGYVRGAFTGAAKDKCGLIESANGGTLFLDEIGDLPLELQTNLLRFLQERTITRIGSSHSITVDVRVIAASHRQLENLVKVNRFRDDLLYRLNVLPLTVPALRDRKDDLELLANHFFKVFLDDKNSRLTGFSVRALRALTAHDWPGNVRELINRIRRAMVLANGRLILPEDLDLPISIHLHRKEVETETYRHSLKNRQKNRFSMINSLEF